MSYAAYICQIPDFLNQIYASSFRVLGSLLVLSREQASSSTYPSYSMATETPAVAPIESGNTGSHRPELRCSVPECSQDCKFLSESALRSVYSPLMTNLMLALTHCRKHEAKHSKPYICQVPNCKHPHFGDKGGLDRHKREVHGSQAHYCPITSCRRHVRGFRRKYNLFEHLKRCHSSQSPNLALPSILRQQNHTSDSMKGQQGPYEGGSSSETVTGGGGRLRTKLENLYKMRAEIDVAASEIDVDIEAVKRSLDLLGEDSPS
jgi:hypothetical protein